MPHPTPHGQAVSQPQPPTSVAAVSAKRRRTMQAVQSRDTKPELRVRRLLHAMGYRYQLHRRDLPGTPDIVFTRRKKVIFVHGCFWHGHDCRRGNRQPVRNAEYWKAKIARNVERHWEQTAELRELGWSVLTLWECELPEFDRSTRELVDFLGPASYLSGR
ncbi:MAG: very short patch repair endonuclease [Acidobacteriota bacterium]|nr:very short patch repair endonuclease [Acidobacteriota bacterium]MDE3265403.1 very short patch repair endonuclease [Acidobacteriota bacterium]